MKKLFAFFVAICATTALWADKVEIDGLYYNLAGDSAEVTSPTSGKYSGNIDIPATVTYDSQTYRVTSIGYRAFGGCSSLASVTIPNSVTSIGESAFCRCDSLTSITIPDFVTSIGVYAFYGCTSLPVDNNLRYADTYLVEAVDKSSTTYTIKNGTQWIGDEAFYECSSLASVTIPNSVTSIGEWAFGSCTSLTSITIPNSVTSIGERAFWDCTSLTSITIPNSVTSIGDVAFEYCPSLVSIFVDAGNKQFSSEDGVLFTYAKDSLIQYPIGNSRTTYTIPNSVMSIGEDAFSFCTSLNSVTIPNSVTSVGDGAFYECDSLTSITIPNSVTSIGNKAFFYCTSLASITCEATTPPTCGSSCFFEVDKTIPLYVPAGSRSTYQAADGWKDFTNIQAITAQEVFVTEIESEPTSTSVEIAWPAVSGSDNYTIEVKQGSKVICTIVFNAQGQLLSINFPTSAPARGIANAQEAVATATGWAYTINGLTPGTAYTYSVVAKDAGGNVLDTKNGSFETTSPTAIENVNDNSSHKGNKVIRDGVLLIKQNGVYYNAQGAVVE